MTEKDINDMAHELWAVVNGSMGNSEASINWSLGNSEASISKTVDRMIPVIREYLSKKHVEKACDKAFYDSECPQMDDKEAIFRLGWDAGRKAAMPDLTCGECGKDMKLRYTCDTPNCVENPRRVMPREDY